MSGLLLSGLVRCQQLVSLRAFMAPPVLSLRHSWHATPCWRQRQQCVQPPGQAGMPSASGVRQLHGGRWRCRAAAAAQPADDLSVNALKRREQELQSSVADAVRVRSMGAADRLEAGPAAAGRSCSTLLPPVGGRSCSSVLNAMPSPVSCPQIANLPALKQRLAGLEEAAGAADLWEQRAKAQAVLQQLTALREEVRQLEQFGGQLEDLALAVELMEMEVGAACSRNSAKVVPAGCICSAASQVLPAKCCLSSAACSNRLLLATWLLAWSGKCICCCPNLQLQTRRSRCLPSTCAPAAGGGGSAAGCSVGGCCHL
jgi:hypothetical protein